jgi:hypothetical protein
LDVIVPNAEVDFLQTGLLGNEPSEVMAPLFSEAASVEDEPQFADALEVED